MESQNLGFQLRKRRQLFIATNDKPPSSAAMRVSASPGLPGRRLQALVRPRAGPASVAPGVAALGHVSRFHVAPHPSASACCDRL